MEWTKLILDFLSSVAWPLIVAGVLVGFRRPIGRLIEDVTDVTLPGGASFRRRIRRRVHHLRVAVDHLPRSVQRMTKTIVDREAAADWLREYLGDIDAQQDAWLTSQHNPMGTVYAASDVLAAALAGVCRAEGLNVTNPWVDDVLTDAGLDPDAITLARQLWQVRCDTAATNTMPSEETAAEYVTAVRGLLDTVLARLA